eukprot:scaffold114568_cov13-Prasinocladus_malaysianus.AAC.1
MIDLPEISVASVWQPGKCELYNNTLWCNDRTSFLGGRATARTAWLGCSSGSDLRTPWCWSRRARPARAPPGRPSHRQASLYSPLLLVCWLHSLACYSEAGLNLLGRASALLLMLLNVSLLHAIFFFSLSFAIH